jgi:hypothetical protein
VTRPSRLARSDSTVATPRRAEPVRTRSRLHSRRCPDRTDRFPSRSPGHRHSAGRRQSRPGNPHQIPVGYMGCSPAHNSGRPLGHAVRAGLAQRPISKRRQRTGWMTRRRVPRAAVFSQPPRARSPSPPVRRSAAASSKRPPSGRDPRPIARNAAARGAPSRGLSRPPARRGRSTSRRPRFVLGHFLSHIAPARIAWVPDWLI